MEVETKVLNNSEGLTYIYFFCSRDGNRIALEVCRARRAAKKYGCGSKCAQGKMVDEIYKLLEKLNGI